MRDKPEFTRLDVLKRLLVTVVLLICFEVVKLLVQLTVIFQYAWLLVGLKRSEPLRQFSNRLSEYAHGILRYATLNGNERSFPYEHFPTDRDCIPGDEPEFP